MADVELKKIEVTCVDGTSYHVPYWHVRSGEQGPCVLVTAGLHGNELQGSEAMRRFLPTVQDQLLSGSCLLIPFANPLAVQRCRPHIDFEFGRYYGSDRENNLNCTWTGDANGTNAQRLSHALFHAVVEEATHLIDLHCWQRRRAATALARTGSEASMRLAEATKLRFARHAHATANAKKRPVTPCTLSTYFHDTDRTAIAVELSGQYGFWTEQVESCLRLLRNAFRHFSMLPGETEGADEPTIWVNDTEMIDIAAPATGVFVHASLHASDRVEEGDLLGHVFTAENLETVEIRAPASGYLFEYGPVHDKDKGQEHTRPFLHPHTEKGDLIAVLARSDA